MNGGPTVEFKVQFAQRRKGRKSKEQPASAPRIPRIAKTMALAIHLQQMIREGLAKDQADLARLGGVTRARVTQIMNLLCLAPDIQEQLLLLENRHAVPIACTLRKTTLLLNWQSQRSIWINAGQTKNSA
jgi:hypothetical protein